MQVTMGAELIHRLTRDEERIRACCNLGVKRLQGAHPKVTEALAAKCDRVPAPISIRIRSTTWQQILKVQRHPLIAWCTTQLIDPGHLTDALLPAPDRGLVGPYAEVRDR